ncbi:MAG: hypothetical protein K8H88_01205, partial [Sandaracinaceae bacterium]|nr:hypothetical protein [Sandaracinaceae bacterium]
SATWSPGTPSGLNSTDPEARAMFAQIGADPEIILTAIGVEAFAPSGASARRVRAIAMVFPDGRVRYSNVEHRVFEDASFLRYQPFPRGNDHEVALAEHVDDLLEALVDDCDSVEMITSEELEDVPASLRADIMSDASVQTRDDACTQVRSLGASAFNIHQIEDVTVIVKGGAGRVAMLRSSLEQSTPGMTNLRAVRVRLAEP